MDTIKRQLDNLIEAGYTLDNVWDAKSPELKEEIINFWLETGALTSHQWAMQRVDQVAMLARDPAGSIAGVSTVVPQYNQQLGHDFYYFRCFVKHEHRRHALATILIAQVYNYFNQVFLQDKNTQIIGLIIELQNKAVQGNQSHAVWPSTYFVYIGQNQRGEPVRVRYFDGAKI